VLSLDAQDDRARSSLPTLAPLAADIDRLLVIVDTAVKTGSRAQSHGGLPDLRASYLAFERGCPPASDGAALLAELDEIVDATDGLAVLAGVDPVDSDPVSPP
jgi:hypothetical protein